MQRTAHIYGEHEVSRLEEVQKLLVEEGYVGGPKESTAKEEAPGERVPRDDTGRDDTAESDEEDQVTEEQVEETRYSVKDLAAKLELTPAQLYNSLDIRLSDGSTMTLSALKDMAIKGKTIDSHTERRDKDYNELMIQRKEVNDVMSTLQAEGRVTEETINKIRAQNDQRIAAEMQLLIKALPDWENQSTREREVKQITDYSRSYGISPQELDALVTDHRLMKLIRDAATKPVSKPKDIIPVRKAPSTPKVTGNSKVDKLAAITALIN